MQRRGQGRRRIRASLRQASASCRNGAVKGDAEIAAAARLRRLPDLRAPDSPRRVKNTQSPPRPRADLRRHRTGLVAGSQQHANKAQVVQLAPFARGITLPRRAAFVGRDLLVGHLVDVLLERQRALLPHRCVGRLDRRQRLNRIGARLQLRGHPVEWGGRLERAGSRYMTRASHPEFVNTLLGALRRSGQRVGAAMAPREGVARRQAGRWRCGGARTKREARREWGGMIPTPRRLCSPSSRNCS
mmetsp:Transcript_13461/g.43938  ORF Transcript_13461/g.43938 Transcript_13461/m.43938 type:complete len:245 (+) Transcript_13461:281-1015(+)